MADVAYIPDQQNQANNILPWMLASQNGIGGLGGGLLPGMLLGSGMGWGGLGGGLFGGSGIGAFLGGLFGSALPGFFRGGFGNWGGNGAGAASALGAQATAIGNTETILRAIDGTDADVRLVATTLNSDINSVKDNLNTVGLGLTSLAGQIGLSREQIVNSILSGNADMALQLCKCCCQTQQQIMAQGYDNQLATMAQTNQLGNAISGASQREVDAIADLKTTIVKEFCDAKERDMQADINTKAEIITQLRNQLDNDRQTAQFMTMLAPIQQQVNNIAAKQPNTVPVQWPNLMAVNATPYVSGGFYQGGGWGNNYFGPGFGGWGNGINF